MKYTRDSYRFSELSNTLASLPTSCDTNWRLDGEALDLKGIRRTTLDLATYVSAKSSWSWMMARSDLAQGGGQVNGTLSLWTTAKVALLIYIYIYITFYKSTELELKLDKRSISIPQPNPYPPSTTLWTTGWLHQSQPPPPRAVEHFPLVSQPDPWIDRLRGWSTGSRPLIQSMSSEEGCKWCDEVAKTCGRDGAHKLNWSVSWPTPSVHPSVRPQIEWRYFRNK